MTFFFVFEHSYIELAKYKINKLVDLMSRAQLLRIWPSNG